MTPKYHVLTLFKLLNVILHKTHVTSVSDVCFTQSLREICIVFTTMLIIKLQLPTQYTHFSLANLKIQKTANLKLTRFLTSLNLYDIKAMAAQLRWKSSCIFVQVHSYRNWRAGSIMLHNESDSSLQRTYRVVSALIDGVQLDYVDISACVTHLSCEDPCLQ